MNVAILGASSNLERYSNKAQLRLMEEGHTVYPVSKKDELIAGIKAYPNLAPIFEKISFPERRNKSFSHMNAMPLLRNW